MNPGTRDAPLATLQAAQELVRVQPQYTSSYAPPEFRGNVRVRIAPGTYYLPEGLVFGPEDGGNKRFRVTWAAADPDNAPVLIGGRRLTDFKAYRDGIFVAPLPAGAGPRVAMENGRRLVPARAPNDRYARIASVDADGGIFWKAGDFPELAAAENRDSPHFRFDLSEGMLNVFPSHEWFNRIGTLASLDAGKRRVTYTHTDHRGGKPGEGNRFYLANLLPLLDTPGECVFRVQAGKFYVKPRKTPIEAQAIVVATADHVITVRGREDRFVYNLHFENLDLSLANSDTVRFENAADCSVRACRIENAGDNGVHVLRANHRITVSGCEIRHVGWMGVYLLGAKWLGPDISFDHTIENCHIHHAGEVLHDGSGIQARQSGRNRIVHNHVHHAPRYGISLKGMGVRFIGDPEIRKRRNELLHARDNFVGYNRVHHVALDSQDAGGLESWGPGIGNVWDHNLVYDIGDRRMLLICGIYLDDSSNQTTVTHNVVYGVVGAGHVQTVFIKGVGNRIENNVFIASRHCGGAIRSKASGEASGHIYRRNIVWFDPANGSKAIYQFDDWNDDRVAVSDYNVFFIPGSADKLRIAGRLPLRGLLDEHWRKRFDTHSLVADPKFVDPANRDYRLKPDSPARKLGIKSVDVRSAGLTDTFPARLDRE